MAEPWYLAFFRGDWQRGAAQAITPESGEAQAQLIAQVLELRATSIRLMLVAEAV